MSTVDQIREKDTVVVDDTICIKWRNSKFSISWSQKIPKNRLLVPVSFGDLTHSALSTKDVLALRSSSSSVDSVKLRALYLHRNEWSYILDRGSLERVFGRMHTNSVSSTEVVTQWKVFWGKWQWCSLTNRSVQFRGLSASWRRWLGIPADLWEWLTFEIWKGALTRNVRRINLSGAQESLNDTTASENWR